MKRVAAVILAAGFVITCPVLAQEEDPGRGVARISVINGDVSVRRGDSGDYVAAAVNGPLVVQDHVVTGNNSRAEVQFDWANMLRLSANTEVRLAELENKRYQVQLSGGTVTHRVLRDIDAEVEINTPSISVRPVKRGTYRIAVLPNGDTEVTVRSGEVEIFSPRGVERLKSGRTMLARGSASDPEFQVLSAIPNDEWDRWNERRDHDLERSRSYQYVSRDIYGADDLDGHGRWVYAPPYGWVWSPYGTGSDWAPYRAGRWVWVDWYGWSWVSYEPWGWAPYHYGRWFHHAPYGWCWFPGPRHNRHYWAPGLVAFFGWGHGPRVGIGFGNVGWVPLAPYETYHRWYGRGYYGGYRNQNVIVNNVRVVNNVNITNVYRNARANGITGLDGDEFGRGGRGRHLRVSDIPSQRASLVQGAIPMTPGRESLRLSNREVTNTPRNAATQDRFFSRRAPASVDRVPFEEQRRGVDRMVRGSFGEQSGQGVRAGGSEPAVEGRGRTARSETGNANVPRPGGETRTMEPAARGDSGNTSRSGGWRRLGEGSQPVTRPAEPAARAEGGQGPATPRTSGDGWRRFGGGQPDNAGGARPSEPRGNTVRETGGQGAREGETRPSDTGNWRRFGGGETEPRGTRGAESRGNGGSRESAPVMENRNEPAQRDDSPRWNRGMERSQPRSEGPRFSAPRSEPIHINPPIVRERATPRVENPGGGNRGGGGGGARTSAPEPRSGGGGRTESHGGGGRSESGRGGSRR